MLLLHSSLRVNSVCRFVMYLSTAFWALRMPRLFSIWAACNSSSRLLLVAISLLSSSISAWVSVKE